jgi:hypothetical protein
MVLAQSDSNKPKVSGSPPQSYMSTDTQFQKFLSVSRHLWTHTPPKAGKTSSQGQYGFWDPPGVLAFYFIRHTWMTGLAWSANNSRT